jgi:glycosyltransferase involved in cell wall biosynthesis
VVDGFSTDDTVEVARALYPDVRVVFQDRPGKGNAVTWGIAAARGNIIVTLDGDCSTDPRELPRFVEAIEDGADFVKGSRFLTGGGSDDLTRLRRSGNWILTRLVNLLFGTRYTDLCYGFNAFRREAAEAIAPDTDGFEIEALLSIRAANAGLRVVEVPSWESSRMHGVSNLKVIRDGWRVLGTILREWRAPRSSPTRSSSLVDDLRDQVSERSRG